MKKMMWCAGLIVVGACLTWGLKVMADESQPGQTSLTITPLDEKLPRIVEIEDLIFEECTIDNAGADCFSSNEPIIRFLDSRVDPIDWELQLKVDNFYLNQENALDVVDYQIKKGVFEGRSAEALAGLEAIEYSWRAAKGEYTPVIRSTGKVDRGWVTYRLPVGTTTIHFADNVTDGHYKAVHKWRLVNINL